MQNVDVMTDGRVESQKKASWYADMLRGHVFKHFKGNLYRVLEIGVDSETSGLLVVYCSHTGDWNVWVRPLDMFLSEVDHEKYPDVTQKFRFVQVDPPRHCRNYYPLNASCTKCASESRTSECCKSRCSLYVEEQ